MRFDIIASASAEGMIARGFLECRNVSLAADILVSPIYKSLRFAQSGGMLFYAKAYSRRAQKRQKYRFPDPHLARLTQLTISRLIFAIVYSIAVVGQFRRKFAMQKNILHL